MEEKTGKKNNKDPKSKQKNRLLEDLAIGEGLALNLHLPKKGTLEEGLVLRLLKVELGEGVRLPIRSDVHDGLVVLTSHDHDTGDERVVGLAEYTHGTHGVLSGSLESVEETTDQVGRHEHLGELIVVLEVDSPDGPTLLVEVLVEPGDGTGLGVFVGVHSLPVVQLEVGLGQVIQGVLGLGLSGHKRLLVIIILSSLLGLGGLGGSRGGGSLGLLLLLGGLVLRRGRGVSDLTVDGSELGALDNGLEESDNVGDSLSDRSVEVACETGVEDGGNGNIGQSNSVTDEESSGLEELLEGFESSLDLAEEGGVDGLVVGNVTGDHTMEGTERDRDLLVGESDPCRDLSGSGDISGNELGAGLSGDCRTRR